MPTISLCCNPRASSKRDRSAPRCFCKDVPAFFFSQASPSGLLKTVGSVTEMCLMSLALPLPIPVPEVLRALIRLTQKMSPAPCSPLAGGSWISTLKGLFLKVLLQVGKILSKSPLASKSASGVTSPALGRGWGCSLQTRCWEERREFAALLGYSCRH